MPSLRPSLVALPSPTSSTSSSSSVSPTSSTPPVLRRKSRVTAEHTLTRVRENQRRHRARRKDYISSLEEKLASTEKQLAEARREIEALRRERDANTLIMLRTQDGEKEKNENVVEELDGVTIEDMQVMELAPESVNADVDVQYPSLLGGFYILDTLPSPIPSDTLPIPDLPPSSLSVTPPCCNDPPTTPTLAPSQASPECSSCSTRPAPLPSESTTLCAQAYVMIQQQNFRGIDATTIRLWLYQGYRRAQREGEGCRVENGALFRLLDYISGM